MKTIFIKIWRYQRKFLFHFLWTSVIHPKSSCRRKCVEFILWNNLQKAISSSSCNELFAASKLSQYQPIRAQDYFNSTNQRRTWKWWFVHPRFNNVFLQLSIKRYEKYFEYFFSCNARLPFKYTVRLRTRYFRKNLRIYYSGGSKGL